MTDTIATTVDALLAELGTMTDAKMQAVNERHGDDHTVNLTKLRGVAKRVGANQELAHALWATGDTDARLLALLVCRPKAFSEDELDTMMREGRRPKIQDWLINYVVKKSPHVEALRTAWFEDADPWIAAAGWALTADRVAKRPDGLDKDALLDQVEREMKAAPSRLQWEMNSTLAQIGITDAPRRPRALEIGERLEVLKDYPTPPNCTSPYAPLWIAEMVRRQQGA
ncbi:DNA alkylation repair protein [Demequina capsici]|uniref:DNA alkylation repair protein n=1 Tax=Demequina capsici TaxID=3075620 RepID=A0AA96JB39_9MICO|nr:DNA alkylation repair protein [Demequina sp. PMTSA13]WNM28005.1 DNA alkylation repair protein [Demequina sp. PMTSA13]